MRNWVVAAGLVLGGVAAADGYEPLFQRDRWVVAHVPPAAEDARPLCILVRIDAERGDRSLSLSVFAADEAVLTVTDGGWSGTPPEAPLGLRIDETRWGMDWRLDPGSAHATVAGAGEVARLTERLAAAGEAGLADRRGAVLLSFPLDGGAPAFAALRDCVATRLGPPA